MTFLPAAILRSFLDYLSKRILTRPVIRYDPRDLRLRGLCTTQVRRDFEYVEISRTAVKHVFLRGLTHFEYRDSKAIRWAGALRIELLRLDLERRGSRG